MSRFLYSYYPVGDVLSKGVVARATIKHHFEAPTSPASGGRSSFSILVGAEVNQANLVAGLRAAADLIEANNPSHP